METSEHGEPAAKADALDVGRVRQLVELMDEHGLSELDLRQGDVRIRLRRETSSAAAPVVVLPNTAAMPVVAAPVPVNPGAAVPQAEPERASGLVEIKSPMVGTFYAASSPDSEPYVRVGSRVNPETTVCVIEAMKVFNEIPAETNGTIAVILVENGEPVEFGQPLFRVDPNS